MGLALKSSGVASTKLLPKRISNGAFFPIWKLACSVFFTPSTRQVTLVTLSVSYSSPLNVKHRIGVPRSILKPHRTAIFSEIQFSFVPESMMPTIPNHLSLACEWMMTFASVGYGCCGGSLIKSILCCLMS